MKCVHCGFDSPSQTKFCTNCGKPLERTVTCPSCQKQVPARGSFCPHCGHKLKGSSRKSRSAPRESRGVRASRGSLRSSKSQNSRLRDFVIAAVIVAILGAGIAGILYSQRQRGDTQRPRNTTQFRPRELPSNSFVWPQEVQSIAAQLDCPCGNCSLNLADCTCDNPNGALEIKSYISSLLKTDKNKDDIVNEVKAKYNPQS